MKASGREDEEECLVIAHLWFASVAYPLSRERKRSPLYTRSGQSNSASKARASNSLNHMPSRASGTPFGGQCSSPWPVYGHPGRTMRAAASPCPGLPKTGPRQRSRRRTCRVEASPTGCRLNPVWLEASLLPPCRGLGLGGGDVGMREQSHHREARAPPEPLLPDRTFSWRWGRWGMAGISSVDGRGRMSTAVRLSCGRRFCRAVRGGRR